MITGKTIQVLSTMTTARFSF